MSFGAEVILANQPNSQATSVLPGNETSLDFMKRIEPRRGLSMSKSLRSDIRVSTKSTHQRNNIGNIRSLMNKLSPVQRNKK